MPEGFGVDPGQVTAAATAFQKEGEAISQYAGKVEHPAVSTGQVGRHFQAVAEPYAQMFTQVNTAVKSFGAAAVATATQLNDVATSYSSTDESGKHTMQSQ